MNQIYIGAVDLSAYAYNVVRMAGPTRLRFDSLPISLIEDLRNSAYPRPAIFVELPFSRLVFPANLVDSQEINRFLVLKFYREVVFSTLEIYIFVQRSSLND